MDCDSFCIPSEGSQCISSISTACDIHHSLSTSPGHNGYHYICTCCHCPNIKRNVVYFNISKYDRTNEIAQKALSSQFTDGKMSEVICKPCHNSLHDECPTMPAHVSLLQHGLDIQCSSIRCMYIMWQQYTAFANNILTSLITIMMHMLYKMFQKMQIQMTGYVKNVMPNVFDIPL